MKEQNRRLILKASEIGQFIYCPVAWHLQRQGYKVESPMLDRGLEEHFNMGEQIDILTEEEEKSRVFLLVGPGLIVISILLFVGWLCPLGRASPIDIPCNTSPSHPYITLENRIE